MLRFTWVLTLTVCVVLLLKHTIFNNGHRDISCTDAERAFEAADFAEISRQHPSLLIGNQRVRYWNVNEAASPDEVWFKRWVNGLNPDRIAQCFPRLIAHYQPAVVVLPIDTEFAVDTPTADIFDGLQAVVDQRSEYKLDFELWVISPLSTPRFDGVHANHLAAVNEEGKRWASNDYRTHWLDFQAVITAESGEPDSKLFWANGDTLSNAGYRRLTERLVAFSNGRK